MMIVMIVGNSGFFPVVKAGKANEFCFAKRIARQNKPQVLLCNNEKVNVSQLEPMVICGNSMCMYGLKDGQTILVEPIKPSNRGAFTTNPVMVFKITNKSGCLSRFDAQYKLRKFLGYVQNPKSADWSEIYNNIPEKLRHVPLEDFTTICSKKAETTDSAKQYVLSETYLCDKECVDFSFHAIETMYAKVQYSI